MAKIVGGIDEAGRGCLVGPLVVAGVSVEKGSAAKLRRLGVRDSKTLTRKKREALYDEILLTSRRIATIMIQPDEIDAVVRTGKKYRKLNYLEALCFARVADELGAGEVVVDASDSSPKRFKGVIMENMRRKCSIVSSHKADRDYAVVSAASIIAKVERDGAVEKLKRTLGDFGSGYPSDPVTEAFFTERLRRGEPLPEQVRKSWKTWDKLQQTLLAPL